MQPGLRVLLVALVLLCFRPWHSTATRDHEFEWDGSQLDATLVGSFGFEAQGTFAFTVQHNGGSPLNTLLAVVAFCPSADIEEVTSNYEEITNGNCEYLASRLPGCTTWNVTFPSPSTAVYDTATIAVTGAYSVFLFGCPSSQSRSLVIYYEFRNPGPSYLSVGWQPILVISTPILTTWVVIFAAYPIVACTKKSCKKKRLRVVHWLFLGNVFLYLLANLLTYLIARLGITEEAWASPNRTILGYVFSAAAATALMCDVFAVLVTWGSFLHTISRRRLRLGALLFFICYALFLVSLLNIALWGSVGLLLKLATSLVIAVVLTIAFLSAHHAWKTLAAIIRATSISVQASVGSPRILRMYRTARCYRKVRFPPHTPLLSGSQIGNHFNCIAIQLIGSLLLALCLLSVTVTVFVVLFQVEIVLMTEWARMLLLHAGSVVAMLICLLALATTHSQVSDAINHEQRFRGFLLASVTLSSTGLLNAISSTVGEMAALDGFEYGDHAAFAKEGDEGCFQMMKMAHQAKLAVLRNSTRAGTTGVLDALGRLDARDVDPAIFSYARASNNPAAAAAAAGGGGGGGKVVVDEPPMPTGELRTPAADMPTPRGEILTPTHAAAAQPPRSLAPQGNAWKSESRESTTSEVRRAREEWEQRPSGADAHSAQGDSSGSTEGQGIGLAAGDAAASHDIASSMGTMTPMGDSHFHDLTALDAHEHTHEYAEDVTEV